MKVKSHTRSSHRQVKSGTTIHVTIGSSCDVFRKRKAKCVPASFNNNVNFVATVSNPSQRETFNKSTSSLDNFKSQQIKNAWLDCATVETNHRQHGNKKKEKSSIQKKLCWSIVALLIMCTVIVGIVILIIFKSTTSKSKTHKEAILRWSKTGITIAGINGQPGTAADRLSTPNGLAFDWSHSLYIADSGNHRVQRYLRGSTTGTTVCGQASGTSGNGTSQLNGARKIVVTSNKSVYVSDRYNHRVQFWPVDSSSGVTVAGIGGAGNGNNQLNTPQGVDIDWRTNTLYIADVVNKRIMKYDSGALFGNVVAGGNGCGYNKSQICNPSNIHFESITNSSIIIVDYDHNNVVRWTVGATEWTYMAGSISMTVGNTSAELNGPDGLAVDVIGNLYVPDKYNHRIQFFPVGQSNGTTIAGVTGISGSNAVSLAAPAEVTVDNQLNLYVSDTSNHRVQKFLRY